MSSSVDGLHHSLRQFAERTNSLVCSANSRLEYLVNHHPAALTAVNNPRRQRLRVADFLAEPHPSPDIALPVPDSPTLPSLRPRLPVEILDTILVFLPPTSIKPLLLTNSFLSAIAQRRFYHTVSIDTPSRAISFLRKLIHHPRHALAPLVRSLDLTLTHPQATSLLDSSPVAPTRNFYHLLARALELMSALVSLTLEFPKSHSPLWIFNRCAFKLRHFSTTMYCNRPLARFLEKQDTIEDLTLRGFQSDALFFLPFLGPAAIAATSLASLSENRADGDHEVDDLDVVDEIDESSPHNHRHRRTRHPSRKPFRLSPSALPRLAAFNAIHAGPSVVRSVMRDRSVTVASVPLFPELSLPTLDALCTGNVPLKRLSIISFDPHAPRFLFRELSVKFCELEALHLVMLMAEYSKGLLEESGALLTNFTSLKYITFMAAAAASSSVPAPPPPPPPPPPPTAASASSAPATISNTNTLASIPSASTSAAPSNANATANASIHPSNSLSADSDSDLDPDDYDHDNDHSPALNTNPNHPASNHDHLASHHDHDHNHNPNHNPDHHDPDPDPDDSHIDEHAIAVQWHQSCPTLRTIILPKGRVWFRGDLVDAGVGQGEGGGAGGVGGLEVEV